tara:strand:- start:191 stop:367 length:177 start_codon:yes stop_codon:yes gene_type:complete
MRQTVYLNMKSNWGTETVDQFTKEEGQTFREFTKYVNEMVNEYHIAGMSVYKSQRACK